MPGRPESGLLIAPARGSGAFERAVNLAQRHIVKFERWDPDRESLGLQAREC